MLMTFYLLLLLALVVVVNDVTLQIQCFKMATIAERERRTSYISAKKAFQRILHVKNLPNSAVW